MESRLSMNRKHNTYLLNLETLSRIPCFLDVILFFATKIVVDGRGNNGNGGIVNNLRGSAAVQGFTDARHHVIVNCECNEVLLKRIQFKWIYNNESSVWICTRADCVKSHLLSSFVSRTQSLRSTAAIKK